MARALAAPFILGSPQACLVHAHPAFHQPQLLADVCHHQGRGEQEGRKGCQTETVSQRQKLSGG